MPKNIKCKNPRRKGLPSGFELLKLNGEKVNETELNNGIVLLNVWASWCITCLVEHPFLNELSETYNIDVIGINYKDKLGDAIKYLDKNGDPYIYSIHDYDGKYALKLGVTGAPETFLLIDGKIVKHRVGEVNQQVWDEEFSNFFSIFFISFFIYADQLYTGLMSSNSKGLITFQIIYVARNALWQYFKLKCTNFKRSKRRNCSNDFSQ